jgi:hypothetical protein
MLEEEDGEDRVVLLEKAAPAAARPARPPRRGKPRGGRR